MIIATNVLADENPEWDTNPGNTTTDRVFLLSIREVNQYFSSDEARKCSPTVYAKAQGAYTSESIKTASGDAVCWWWLRSPGYSQSRAAYVRSTGSPVCYGYDVRSGHDCVRPALWINLDP